MRWQNSSKIFSHVLNLYSLFVKNKYNKKMLTEVMAT